MKPTSLITDRSQYLKLLSGLQGCSESERTGRLRTLAQTDLFFLLVYILRRHDADSDWCFARCREVQDDPNGRLDLWAREHYKSTIITFALTIQDILNDPEITVGIFSHTRPIAKGFLRQIKRELETNDLLKGLFPDILWRDPRSEAPKWSEDEGLIVRRRGNPKEATLEASGLVDGQPTSKHYKLRVYDDVVTRESVTTPDMIAKVTEAWELSINLGSEGGWERYIGTRYNFNDTYKTIMDRGSASPRVYPATVDGTVEGEPVLLTRESLDKKRRDMGPYTFGCQMLQNPIADATQGFKLEWLKHYQNTTRDGQNVCILVDGASEKKKTSDYTAMFVVGFNSDGNAYILDMVRDRLSLTERSEALFNLHRRWKPTDVGYEKYGMMADIEHIYAEQERRNYRFGIRELGGPMPKNDRIRRLIPLFEQGKMWLPTKLYYTNYEKRVLDLVKAFEDEEYKPFPVGLHDDMLDGLSRMFDLYPGGLPWPLEGHNWNESVSLSAAGSGGWLAA